MDFTTHRVCVLRQQYVRSFIFPIMHILQDNMADILFPFPVGGNNGDWC
jgi:hypothetical protein